MDPALLLPELRGSVLLRGAASVLSPKEKEAQSPTPALTRLRGLSAESGRNLGREPQNRRAEVSILGPTIQTQTKSVARIS